MQNLYFTVGPSQTYPTVPEHIKKAVEQEIFSLNHRGSKFTELYHGVEQKLKTLLGIPESYSVFFLSSGTEAMERVIENTVENTSFHIVTGTFGDRFYKTAVELKKTPVEHEFEAVTGFDPEAVSVPKDAELVAFTHNDTSTGCLIPMEDIARVADQNREALVAVDTVSSVPYGALDYSFLDCVFFSVQKGFGLPAGLGVLIVSPRALEKAKLLGVQDISTGSYHSFESLSKYAQKGQTPDTPNVFGIFLLDKVLDDFVAKGIDLIRSETEEKARMLYDFFASHSRFEPLVKDPRYQSQTTLVITVDGGSKDIQESLKKQGILIGSGYGENKYDHIRIANFPAHTLSDSARLIEALKKIA